MKRITIILAVLGAVAAVLVPAAVAKPIPGPGLPAASFYTPEALEAWGQRAEAQAEFFLNSSSGSPAASFYTPAALRAMGERAQAQAVYYQTRNSPSTGSDDRIVDGIRGTGPVSTVTPVSDDGLGTWDKVGIGVGGAAFALLLGGGLVATLRRSRVAHA
jgi:hypothetical protein